MTRFFVFLATFSAIFFVVEFYGYLGIKQLTAKLTPRWRKIWRWSYWIPSLVSVALIVVLAIGSQQAIRSNQFGFFYFATGFIFLFLFPKLLFLVFHLLNDVVRLVLWAFRKLTKKKPAEPVDEGEVFESEKMTRFQFFNQVGLGAAALTFGATIYGITRGKYDFRILEEELYFPNLPEAFHGLKVVQISDAHLGSFLDNSFEEVNEALEKINALQPDLILFTGDLVNNFAEEALPWVNYFEKLNANLGKFSILGNHDYAEYVYDPNDELTLPMRTENMKQLEAIHAAMGFRLLKNEWVEVVKDGQAFNLIGIENWGRGRFSKHGDLEKAMTNLPANSFSLLLSHDPSHWEEQVMYKKNIDLTLSGHTHGAQFGLEAPMLHIKASPSPLFGYKRWGGLYQEGKQYLYVNRGFGFLGFPGRIGMPPEITSFKLFKS